MINTKQEAFLSKTISTVHNALENIVMWNGFSVQEILLEANAEYYFIEYAEFCMVEYLQVFYDEVLSLI